VVPQFYKHFVPLGLKTTTENPKLPLLPMALETPYLIVFLREDRSELAAHQPRTQNANSHAFYSPPPSLPSSGLHLSRDSVSCGFCIALAL